MSDSAKPTLLVIDGHSLAFRAFFALPVDSFTTRDGQHTNAVHGFLSMLLLVLRTENPTHIAVAFDKARQSFRTREYTEYKANRAETPSEFKGQIALLKECLHALGIITLEKDDFEADDILATLARQGTEQGFAVQLVSGDRDTIQLVNDRVTLLYPSRQGVAELTRYDPARVQERYGIRPEQYPEIAALVGETSDNLPGIPKVGEKTAVKWLNQFGSLDAILERAEEIKGVVGQNLRDHKESAIRNRRLNRLIDDVELEVGPADLVRKPADEQQLRDVFGRLEFRTLLERVLKQEGMDIDSGEADRIAAQTAVAIPHSYTLTGEALESWFATQTTAHPGGLGLTVETANALPISFGVATPEEILVLPWRTGDAGLAPLEKWLASDAPKVVFGGKTQMKAMIRAGLKVSALDFDVAMAAWLLRPDRPDATLAELVFREFGETMAVTDPNQLIPDDTGPSGPGADAWYTLRLSLHLHPKLDEGTRFVLEAIEMPVLRVLADMELLGVAVDRPILAELSEELGASAHDIAQEAFSIIGREINLGSPKQIQEVLFDQLQMPNTRATKTGYSTDATSLADLQESSPHPFLGLLLQHRDATKLRQIVESLDKSVASDGRIHTSYGQTGTSTGRISSTDPNLQNIPIRTDEGRRIRTAFTVGQGYETLLTADYSQIEMRIMAHLSADAGLIEAFTQGEDLHRFVGARVFGVDPGDVTAAMRSKVKAMSYGLAYGLSAFGLSKQLRIETAEARQLMTDYFERFGAVRDYLRNVVAQARQDGYTTTIFGRRRPFPDLTSTNRVLRDNAERQALNAPIQGSAADIIKIAMVGIHGDIAETELRSRLLLQVHDELVFDVAAGEWDPLEEIVRRRMSGAAALAVPLDVQIGRGQNWDDAAH